jgi:hypothetical protein
LGLAFVIGFGALVGCADLFGPNRTVEPQLSQIFIDDLTTSLRDGGVLYVHASPMDTTIRLQIGQRVPIQISVTSGDREDAGLYRLLCPPRDRGDHYRCFDFVVYMRDGVDVRTVAERLRALNGRFELVSSSGRFATVTLFETDDLVRRARDARDWPGVLFTELTGVACQRDVPTCVSLSDLLVPIPVDTGAAAPGDGIIQVRSGDTVIVAYAQPEGGTLEARASVP